MDHYGHDLHGALVRGHARRTKQAVSDALTHAEQWTEPMGGRRLNDPYRDTERAPRIALRLVVEQAALEARRRGVSADDVKRVLTDKSGSERRERKLADEAHDHPLTEDPTRGAEWHSYDDMVDKMSTQELREALKIEARLRSAAQAAEGS